MASRKRQFAFISGSVVAGGALLAVSRRLVDHSPTTTPVASVPVEELEESGGDEQPSPRVDEIEDDEDEEDRDEEEEFI